MANHGCNNGSLEGTNYASPVPVIGLYVAAASLVCMLLMLYDVVAGFCSGKRWLPCKFFSLNSVTLTLLSIATKLPVDLTTAMPGVPDQFSKLSGTTLLCISMCVLMPSLGSKDDSQCLANMAALSIFVITVIVNICMQISTGVIVLFIPEHIVVICCILILLVVLWVSAFSIDIRRGFSLEQNKSLLLLGEKSMFERLKLCYLYLYNSDPQFVICKHPICATISGLCLLSLVVLLQAAIRSFILNQLSFCGGTSDYTWSMWPIVAIQILTVLVGSLATSIRWLTSYKHMNPSWISDFDKQDLNSVLSINHIRGIDSQATWGRILKYVLNSIVFILKKLIMLWTGMVIKILQFLTLISTCWGLLSNNAEGEESENLIEESDMELDKWSIRQRMMDMKEWMISSISESPNLVELLSKRPSERLPSMENGGYLYSIIEGIEVSSLSLVVLVKIAEVSLPRLSKSLVQAFNEAYGIIRLIDDRINSVDLENRKKSILAKAVLKGNAFDSVISGESENTCIQSAVAAADDYDTAIEIISKLTKCPFESDLLRDEVNVFANRILQLNSSWYFPSVEYLYRYIEQLVVDMLHVYLAQLPNAIYKEVMESPAEEYEETLKVALNIINKVLSLDVRRIKWSFPAGCNISSLIVDSAATQNRTYSLHEHSVITLAVAEDVSANVSSAHDVIDQV